MHAQEDSGFIGMYILLIIFLINIIFTFSEPITIEKDNEIFDIFIMDSEGLGGVEKNQNYDIKIFTLSLLLSSFLIYN
jgi:hypothetical protein